MAPLSCPGIRVYIWLLNLSEHSVGSSVQSAGSKHTSSGSVCVGGPILCCQRIKMLSFSGNGAASKTFCQCGAAVCSERCFRNLNRFSEQSCSRAALVSVQSWNYKLKVEISCLQCSAGLPVNVLFCFCIAGLLWCGKTCLQWRWWQTLCKLFGGSLFYRQHPLSFHQASLSLLPPLRTGAIDSFIFVLLVVNFIP